MPIQDDEYLISDIKLAKRFDVHTVTIKRWRADPELGFPQPLLINRRLYTRMAEVRAWEAKQRRGVAA